MRNIRIVLWNWAHSVVRSLEWVIFMVRLLICTAGFSTNTDLKKKIDTTQLLPPFLAISIEGDHIRKSRLSELGEKIFDEEDGGLLVSKPNLDFYSWWRWIVAEPRQCLPKGSSEAAQCTRCRRTFGPAVHLRLQDYVRSFWRSLGQALVRLCNCPPPTFGFNYHTGKELVPILL